jgi:hypothetical protein
MAKILIAVQPEGAVGYFKLGADINDGRWPVWEISEKILEPAHGVGNELVRRRPPDACEAVQHVSVARLSPRPVTTRLNPPSLRNAAWQSTRLAEDGYCASRQSVASMPGQLSPRSATPTQRETNLRLVQRHWLFGFGNYGEMLLLLLCRTT